MLQSPDNVKVCSIYIDYPNIFDHQQRQSQLTKNRYRTNGHWKVLLYFRACQQLLYNAKQTQIGTHTHSHIVS